MAIGIDKLLHVRLVNGLHGLAKEEESTRWISLLKELEQAYEKTDRLQQLAERTACLYNQLQAKVRSEVANEQRNRKRKSKRISSIS